MYALLRPLLFALPPETAHAAALGALAIGRPLVRLALPRPPARPRRVLGLEFPNPVGLAAGLDKDGRHLPALAALGFGFVEVGTVTPRPQPGNPPPRLFRLAAHEALINRMGFNNEGAEALARRLERRPFPGILGINVGRNRDTPNEQAAEDCRRCMERLFPFASYLVVNLSSPNSPGLRALQAAESLRRLAGELLDARERLAARHRRRVPLLFKLAPDLEPGEIEAIAAVVSELALEGLVLTNTTVAREGLEDEPLAPGSAGGLSGRPLRARAEAVLRAFRERLGPGPALIGVGGIASGADAAARFAAGADLIQLYTGLVYRGPRLIAECVRAAPPDPRA
ncbi:MAG: quinone-dependent dihydroorotate dehydrogenase [Xanthomonadales bacterium]|nr:quinone-dependent dihydroorotate dehydrogenase [Xanthomonadales bacterium]